MAYFDPTAPSPQFDMSQLDPQLMSDLASGQYGPQYQSADQEAAGPVQAPQMVPMGAQGGDQQRQGALDAYQQAVTAPPKLQHAQALRDTPQSEGRHFGDVYVADPWGALGNTVKNMVGQHQTTQGLNQYGSDMRNMLDYSSGSGGQSGNVRVFNPFGMGGH